MQWEYEIQNFGIPDEDDALDKAKRDLNEFGSDGWEIFAIIPGPAIPGINKPAQTWLYAFAKRPYPSYVTASEMASTVDIDPKVFRQALRDAKLPWHEPDTEWKVLRDSQEYKDMEGVLHQLLSDKQKKH
jgi:hypothetical protein